MAENMIKDYEFDKFENPYSSFKRSELGDKLAKFERLVNNLDIPVLIIIDGWESSGKGFVLNDLIRELDPRLHKVSVFENPTEEERERPFLWRFWKKTPAKGNMAVFDRSFYFNLMNDLNIDGEELKQDEINDDLSLVVETEYGLVVILGCAHHGIVNNLKQAQKVTGQELIYAAVGGTHLVHASRERMAKTAAALREMGVQYLGASHCTGFAASAYLAGEFGERFFQNNAGTRLTLPFKE